MEATGILLTILPFIEKVPRVKTWLRDKPFLERYAWLLWVVGGLCIVYGFYNAWYEQREKTIAAERKLEELTQPKLHLTIDELGVGNMKIGTKPTTGVMVVANLTNDGAPSIAESWQLRTTLTDGRTAETGATYMNPSKTMTGHGMGGDWKMSQGDALYVKASRPIQKGDKVRGVLVFTFDMFTLDEMSRTGTKFKLRCADVKNMPVENELTFTDKKEPFHYFPGLSPIPH